MDIWKKEGRGESCEVDEAGGNICVSCTYSEIPRIPWQGAPKLYSTHMGESLNRCLRSIAAFCHRRTFSTRVHRLIDMVGRLVSP
eukprot:5775349-Pyramimonas_sp.AAC.1